MTSTAMRRRSAHPASGNRLKRDRNGQPERARREISLDDKYVLDQGRVLLTGRAGPRPAGARAAPRRPQPRPPHRHDDLGLPGLAAGRARQGAPAQPQAARRRTTCATCPASTRSSAQPPPGAASSPLSFRARTTTACWACGTARHPAWTAPQTPCATATSWGCPAPAAASPSWATTRAASPPRSRARPSRCSRASTCRSSSPATCRRSWTSACTPTPARAPRGCGPASRSSRAWPTPSARSMWRPAASPRCCPTSATSTSRPATCWPRRRSRWSAACWACAPTSRSPTRARTGSTAIEGAKDAWLGIVAGGKAYHDLKHALRSLGLDNGVLERAGIRILKLGMIWPLEQEIVREFARGLGEILVVEEKGPFLETLVKETPLRHARALRPCTASATSAASACSRRSSTSTPT